MNDSREHVFNKRQLSLLRRVAPGSGGFLESPHNPLNKFRASDTYSVLQTRNEWTFDLEYFTFFINKSVV